MALDPQAANVIDLIIKSGRPAYHTLSPKEARRLFLETRPASTPPAPQLGAVRDVSAEGPLGAIPLRVYRPAGVPDSTRLPVHVFRSEERRVGDATKSRGAGRRRRATHSA